MSLFSKVLNRPFKVYNERLFERDWTKGRIRYPIDYVHVMTALRIELHRKSMIPILETALETAASIRKIINQKESEWKN